MTHLQVDDDQHTLNAVRRRVRLSGHVQQAQLMVAAASIAAFGIVAVAAAMITTLL